MGGHAWDRDVTTARGTWIPPRRSCWMQCQTDQTSAECPDLTQEAGPQSLARGDAAPKGPRPIV